MRLALMITWLLGFSSTVIAQYDSAYEREINASTYLLTRNTYTDMMIGPAGFVWLGGKNGLIRYDGTNLNYFFLDGYKKIINNYVVDIMYIKAERKLLVRLKSGEVFTVKNEIPTVHSTKLAGMDYKMEVNGAFPSTVLFDRFNIPVDTLIDKYNWSKKSLSVLTVNATDFLVESRQPTKLYYYKNGEKYRDIDIDTKFSKFGSSGSHLFLIDDQHRPFLFNNDQYTFTETTVDLPTIPGDSKEIKLKDFSVFSDDYSSNIFYVYKNFFFLLQPSADGKSAKLVLQYKSRERRLVANIVYDTLNKTFFVLTQNHGFFQIKKQTIRTDDINKLVPDSVNSMTVINYSVLKKNDSVAVVPSGFSLTNTSSRLVVQKMGKLFGNRETLGIDANGNVLCAESQHVFYYSPKDNYHVKHVYNAAFNDSNRHYIPLLYPEADSVWVCSRRAVFCLTKKVSKLLYRLKSNNIGTYPDPCLFYRLSDHDAYISSPNGLYKIRTSYPYRMDTIPEFKDVAVRHILPYKNVLILSTYGKGLWIQADNRFYRVPLRMHMPQLNQTHSTYIDNRGFLWIPTDNGLYKTDADMLVWYALHQPVNSYPFFQKLSEPDGIKNTEFNGGGTPSYAALKDRLIYPSMGGLVSFDPNEVSVAVIKSNIVLNSILKDDNIPVPNVQDSVYFDADERLLTVDFSVANYSTPENIQLDYRLDTTGEWTAIKMPGESKIRSVLVPQGEHTLYIRRRIGFGTDDFMYKQLWLFRKTYFYQQPWFYIISLLFLFALIWLTAFFRTRNLNRKRLVLQQLVDEQTSQLARSVELKDLLIGIISHDMIAPLKHVSLLAGILEKGLEKDPDKLYKALGDIKTTSDKILTNSWSIINWIKLNNKQMPVQKVPLKLQDLVAEVIATYQSLATAKGLTIRNDVDPSIMAEVDATIVATILNNLISNSIKYADKGEIIVRSRQDEKGNLVLTISDEGTGIQKDMLYTIRQVLANNTRALKNSPDSGTRLGYLLIAELARMHGATVSINSEPGQGTEVAIVIAKSPNKDDDQQ